MWFKKEQKSVQRSWHSMWRWPERWVVACRVFLFLLFNSNVSSIKCGLWNGGFGVYSCTSVSTECVRIFGTDPEVISYAKIEWNCFCWITNCDHFLTKVYFIMNQHISSWGGWSIWSKNCWWTTSLQLYVIEWMWFTGTWTWWSILCRDLQIRQAVQLCFVKDQRLIGFWCGAFSRCRRFWQAFFVIWVRSIFGL